VTRIDEGGNVVQTVTAGSGADAVAAGPDAVWVANDLERDGHARRSGVEYGARDDPGRRRPERHRGDRQRRLGEQRARRNALEDRPGKQCRRADVKTGNRPEGVVVTSGQMFLAVRASGTGHRGGTLTVLTPSADFTNIDPAAYFSNSQVLALTNDGLTGFRRVGASAGTRLVPDLATTSSCSRSTAISRPTAA
jgi:hypothetical protein